MKKTILFFLAAAMLAAVGWRVYAVLYAAEAEPRRTARPVAVAVEPIRTTTLRHVGEFSGELQSTARYVVAPNISGRLEKLHVNFGDVVEKGQLIAELDAREYAQAQEQARAELQVANAAVTEAESDLATAKRDLERSLRLYKRNAVSQSELDQDQAAFDAAQARLEVAQAQVRQKQAALETARVRLDYTRIHAWWRGNDALRVVGERFADEGAMLQANDPVVSVVATEELLAVINVIERDYPLIHIGQEAEVFADAYPNQAYPGTVARKAPVLQQKTRQARVEVLVPNPDGVLAPGMFTVVKLVFAERVNATAAPVAALSRRMTSSGELHGVFLVNEETDPKTVTFTPVIVGVRQGDLAEVVEPDLSGRVVTLGKHLLEDGSAISIPADRQHFTDAAAVVAE